MDPKYVTLISVFVGFAFGNFLYQMGCMFYHFSAQQPGMRVADLEKTFWEKGFERTFFQGLALAACAFSFYMSGK
jgi:hypothetical protein